MAHAPKHQRKPNGQRPQRKWNPNKFLLQDIDLVPRNRELVELMTCCCHCWKIPPPNSFVCLAGHITCYECLNGSYFCRFEPEKDASNNCGKQMRIQECFVYRLLFESSIIQCPGVPCREKYLGKEIKLHGGKCAGIENVSCLLSDCRFDKCFTIVSIVDHLIECHNVPLIETVGLKRFPLKKQYFGELWSTKVPFMLEFRGRVFIFLCTTAMMKGEKVLALILYSLAEFVPPGINKFFNKFYASLTVNGRQEFSRNWEGVLPSVREKVMNIVKGSKCLIISGYGNLASLQSIDIILSELQDDLLRSKPASLLWEEV